MNEFRNLQMILYLER